MPNDSFLNLNDEKKKKIISAGFYCFSIDGYQKTSMSEIANKAEVSKASLFHYFNTKRNFYDYLYTVSCEWIVEGIVEGTDDFFESLKIGSKSKFEIMKNHPYMYDFLLSVSKEDNPKLSSDFQKDNAELVQKGMYVLFKNVNWDKFSDDIDRQTAIEMVTHITNGYLSQVDKNSDPEGIADQVNKYLDILKKSIYKEEYQ